MVRNKQQHTEKEAQEKASACARMDDDAELARAIAASLGEDSPPPAVPAAARAPVVDQDDELYARALQASMEGLPQHGTGLPAFFPAPGGSPAGGGLLTPREPAMQDAIMASTRVQNREDDELTRALAASLAQSEGGAGAAAAPMSIDGDDELAAAIAASMGEPPADRRAPTATESFASIAGLPAAAGLRESLGAAGGLDAAALAATMGLTVDPTPAGLAALGLPPAVGSTAGAAGAAMAGGMSEDEQISAAVMASSEDDMERAIMMSLAASNAGGSDGGGAADDDGAGSGLGALEPAGAASVFEPMPAAAPPRPLGGADNSQADADEADDIAQAIAASMGHPIDRGRRPVGAADAHRRVAAPETPPGVRAARLERQEQDQAYQAGLMEDEARRIMAETAAQAEADAEAAEARQREGEHASAREE